VDHQVGGGLVGWLLGSLVSSDLVGLQASGLAVAQLASWQANSGLVGLQGRGLVNQWAICWACGVGRQPGRPEGQGPGGPASGW
jgi:hypothetical protein